MATAAKLQISLLPGALALLRQHARELPQRDDLCGAFCGALSLHAAGIAADARGPLDQDAVAVAAGSVIAGARAAGTLPAGESGRRDYRLAIPTIDDEDASGTTADGLRAAIERLSDGRLAVIPYRGPWTARSLAGLFDLGEGLDRPVTLIANLATHHLWGSHATLPQMLGHLVEGTLDGPPPDWRVGHFVCVFGRVQGPRGTLYGVADTYPSLGEHGVHMQPAARLCEALERRDMPAGGMLAVIDAADAESVRAGAGAVALQEGTWDNGTITAETAA